MNELKAVLEKILKNTPGFEKKNQEWDVFHRWEEAVGSKIAKHARPVRLTDDGVLVVTTENSSWTHHLKFMERQIVEKLQKTLQSDTVKSLRFYVTSEFETKK